jgi:hypothetical protein
MSRRLHFHFTAHSILWNAILTVPVADAPNGAALLKIEKHKDSSKRMVSDSLLG